MTEPEFLFITKDPKYLQELKRTYLSLSLPTAIFTQMDSVPNINDYFFHHKPLMLFIDSSLQSKDIHHLLLDLQMFDYYCQESNIVLIIERDRRSAAHVRQALDNNIQQILFYPFSYEECAQLFLRTNNKKESSMETEETESRLAQSLRSLRNSFMNRFLESESILSTDRETLNVQYHMNLCEGLFRFTIIEFPTLSAEYKNMSHRLMQDYLVGDIRQVFDPVCYDVIPFVRDARSILIILNYSHDQEPEKYFHQLPVLIGQAMDNYGLQFPYAIGVGNTVSNIRELNSAYQAAQYGLRCQLLYGYNRVYVYNMQSFDKFNIDAKDYEKWLEKISSCAEHMDDQGLIEETRKIFASFPPRLDPAVITDICVDLAQTVITSMQKVTQLDERDKELTQIFSLLDTHSSLNGLRSALCEWVSQLLNRYKNLLNRPLPRSIYNTMYFIDQNYSSHLTLQNLSELAQLSPSYFCHLFKENIGMSFMDYLTEVRLEHAKNYLSDTDYSVAHISEMVGYSDSRYFSRIFTKKIGISPSEFRRQNWPIR